MNIWSLLYVVTPNLGSNEEIYCYKGTVQNKTVQDILIIIIMQDLYKYRRDGFYILNILQLLFSL